MWRGCRLGAVFVWEGGGGILVVGSSRMEGIFFPSFSFGGVDGVGVWFGYIGCWIGCRIESRQNDLNAGDAGCLYFAAS